MTLVITVNGPDTIWMMADRRLSNQGRVIKDDARKIMLLTTPDAVAVIGYCGLGSTALGTEPSDWMSAVLRGRNDPLEISLGILSNAIRWRLLSHLATVPTTGIPQHHVIVPALVNEKAQLYSIDYLIDDVTTEKYRFRYTRHIRSSNSNKPPTIGIGGSGEAYMLQTKQRWVGRLRHLVKANDRGRISDRVVADYLAELNHDAHKHVIDGSIGPRCIVVWRHRKSTRHKTGGGVQYYTGVERDPQNEPLPEIAHGLDVQALVVTLIPHFTETMKKMHAGDSSAAMNADQINADVARLPSDPDETLR